MKINQIIPTLIKVSDKLSTTRDFEVASYLDSIIKKMAQATKQNVKTSIEEPDLKFASEVEAPMIRDAAVITLIKIADTLDKANPKLANRVDAAIKLLAQNKCQCECNKCTLCKENSGTTKHCCRQNRGCNF